MNKYFWLLAILTVTAFALHASGSYPPPIVRPPGAVESSGSVDAAKYNLGKDLLAARVKLPDAPLSAETLASQEKVFAGYAEKLPKPVRETTDFKPLVGRLSADQLSAVAYFLTIRHKVKLD
jgi:hypothetical protein